jgi:predicted DNA-binding ribbon-helix-helix protein
MVVFIFIYNRTVVVDYSRILQKNIEIVLFVQTIPHRQEPKMIETKTYAQTSPNDQTQAKPSENISNMVKNISMLTHNVLTQKTNEDKQQIIDSQIEDQANSNQGKKAAIESKSTLVSKNVVIAAKRTSVRLEPEMWDGIHEISQREGLSVHKLCTGVSEQKLKDTSLTAAIRVFIMRYFRTAATEDGHKNAYHGNSILENANKAIYCSQQSQRFTPTSFS